MQAHLALSQGEHLFGDPNKAPKFVTTNLCAFNL